MSTGRDCGYGSLSDRVVSVDVEIDGFSHSAASAQHENPAYQSDTTVGTAQQQQPLAPYYPTVTSLPPAADAGCFREQRVDENRSRRHRGCSALGLSMTLAVCCSAALYRIRGNIDTPPDQIKSTRPEGMLNYILPSAGFNFNGILSGSNNPADGSARNDVSSSSGSSGNSNPFACEYAAEYSGIFSTSGEERDLRVIQTSKKDPDVHWADAPCSKREEDGGDFAAADDAANIVIDLSSEGKRRTYQRILGFGGSVTEATTLNWKSLSTVAQDRVIELIYGDSGLGYTLGRVPMGSCDFAVSSYNFADEEDLNLDNFDTKVERDFRNGMIDMIKRARYVTEHSWEDDVSLRMVASPWSPPAWMKRPLPTDPKDATHAGTMERTAQPECLREGTERGSKYARAWANYFSKFLSAYGSHGIDIWAVTVQNEPLSSPDFEACGHDKITEKEFVAHHLGPVLSNDHPDVKILAYDYIMSDCVDFMEHLWDDDPVLAASDAPNYIDGVALHWYSKWSHQSLDGGEGAPNMHRLAALASQQQTGGQESETGSPILLDTEATHCTSTGYAIGDIDVSWRRAERNAHAILSQLAAGSSGWIEWNMMLDPFGGPNHVENFCDAPLVAVPHRAEGLNGFIQPVPSFEKHQLQDGEAIKGEYETKLALNQMMGYPMSFFNDGVVVQPMFYYVGHISRYVRPGSRPLKALVDESIGGRSSRVFRPAGRPKPGGGYNIIARAGIEVTLWPCEGSTRQSWFLSGDGQLQAIQINEKSQSECVSLSKSADVDLGGLVLTECGSPDTGLFSVVPQAASPRQDSVQLVKFVSRQQGNECLGIRPLANDGGAYGPRGGAQATIVPCKHGSTLWEFSPQTGEVLSNYYSSDQSNDGSVCLTTGWPFLQAGVFDTSDTPSDSDAVVIVLNESNDDAKFVVKMKSDEAAPILKSSIPAHSIQTIIL